MLTIKDVSPTPMIGQYWAWLNPLSLLKVVYGAPNDCIEFTWWSPGGEGGTNMSIVAPLNNNFRILRWSIPYDTKWISKVVGVEVRTGDVFELSSGGLAFAVLEDRLTVTLYSDEKLTTMDTIDSVVQRGPGPVDKAVKTRYERIIDESKSNTSLVRSVGRVLLREKEQGSLLFPNTNGGTEVRTITNLNLIQRS